MHVVEVTVACTRVQALLCMSVHMAYPETAHVDLGSTF
jgi:hypothetical protein